ncbi:neutral/alkaline non-lysosomal ceramidase N-terminal domain-containing protein [Parachlamydia sp. AcF125]|uniref:neutral/alkaline non-lysosomal ceramidase N-terminal domain-containing protein n=1 Tax=Parachlamydia sp. AcF125 TaxID=2795736 RepID=UPI001BC98EF7|nr:neutral/alkaline non-lysosomal ceramidase N-terminal domain-containing protein [Parachlamydia sp. AcF125]MBS4168854.1 Neutral ceramidase [Parachlamydia sp. AcF125]
MKTIARSLFFLLALIIPTLNNAGLNVGIGKANITPAIGTPSAGYTERKGEGMQGIHDPLLAIALFIDNGEKQIVLCSVDHLGFTYEMVQEIIQQVHRVPKLGQCGIYIASSHTHSGGGAYLNIPLLGESLAGPYNLEVTKFYVEKTVEAIIQASQNLTPSKIGIGYGKAENLSKYRGLWPTGITPVFDMAVIKVTKLDEAPLAVLFNYAVHPTILDSQNRLFSADFVGYARDHLKSLLGSEVQPIYFNGAQGDIIPVIFNEEDRFASCDQLGRSLAETVKKIWNEVKVDDSLHIQTQSEPYAFKPQATPFGLSLPLEQYKSEMNAIVLNQLHAFITIPGELSCIYDQRLKEIGNELGYSHVSIFGLTNDAHGYIILPEAWRHKTSESALSFGGESYGELTKNRATVLLKNNAPK